MMKSVSDHVENQGIIMDWVKQVTAFYQNRFISKLKSIFSFKDLGDCYSCFSVITHYCNSLYMYR